MSELPEDYRELPFRTLAIVSGKGGSGKTMIAATIMAILAQADEPETSLPIVLMDADVGTSGLSYYLGLRYVRSIRGGLTEYAKRTSDSTPLDHDSVDSLIWSLLQPITGVPGTFDTRHEGSFFKPRFLPLGDSRVLMRRTSASELPRLVGSAVRGLAGRPGALIVDCRGGIDEESLAVCEEADDVIVVVEPDITSVQASRHLVDVLGERGLDHKLRGFIINKEFEDPTVVARTGSSMFGAQYLGAIPFDLEATRSFLIGELPRTGSLFEIHVRDALSRVYSEVKPPPRSAVWRPSDFDRLTLLTPESTRGGMLAATALIAIAVGLGISLLVTSVNLAETSWILATGLLVVVGLFGSVEPARRILGRLTASLGNKRRSD